jgi:O-antigen/teichoic acid export membrane protein
MLFQHSAIYLLGRLLPALTSLLSLAVLTRLLTTEQYGYYALAITSAGVLSGVVFQWLSLSMARFVPVSEQPAVVISTTMTAFAALVAVSALAGAVVVGAAWGTPLAGLAALSLLLGWSLAWFDLNQRLANVSLAPTLYGIMGSAKAVLGLAAGIALFSAGFGIAGIVAGLAAGLLAAGLMGVRYWRDARFGSRDGAVFARLVQYGAPSSLTYILIYVIDASDRYFIGLMLGVDAVGVYAPAYDLAQQSIGMLMSVVYLAAYPLALKALADGGAAAASQQVRTNGLLLMLVALPATVGLALLSDNVSAVLFGARFQRDTGAIISIVAAAVFVAGVRAYYFDYGFQLAGKLLTQVWVFVWAAATNVVLNLLLIPRFGLVGAAYATLAAFVVATLISRHLARKVFPMPALHPDVKRVALAAGCMALALLLVREQRGAAALALQVAAGALVYGAALLALDVHGMRARALRWRAPS